MFLVKPGAYCGPVTRCQTNGHSMSHNSEWLLAATPTEKSEAFPFLARVVGERRQDISHILQGPLYALNPGVDVTSGLSQKRGPLNESKWVIDPGLPLPFRHWKNVF